MGGRSLHERLALAPDPVRRAIVDMLPLVGMSQAERERDVRPLRADPRTRDLADAILAGLPAPGLSGQALVDAELAFVVEQLQNHGGETWLREHGHTRSGEASPDRLPGLPPDASDGGPAR